MKTLKLFFFCLIINFGALALGVLFMDNGPLSNWYINLNKAPWTPPGWAFGAAWSLIMICFSVYLAFLFNKNKTLNLKIIFIIQFLLNISWNYVFFNQHQITIGLLVITSLTILIFYLFYSFKSQLKNLSYLLLPYMIWLLIATSLNAYILLNN